MQVSTQAFQLGRTLGKCVRPVTAVASLLRNTDSSQGVQVHMLVPFSCLPNESATYSCLHHRYVNLWRAPMGSGYEWPEGYTGIKISVMSPHQVPMAIDAIDWTEYDDAREVANLFRSAGVQVADVLLTVAGRTRILTFDEFEEEFDIGSTA